MLKKWRIWAVFAAIAGFVWYVIWVAPSMPVQETAQSEAPGKEQRPDAKTTETSKKQRLAVGPAVLSPDGHSALVVFDDRIVLFDLVNGRVQKTFARHLGNVNAVAVSPDSNTALSGSSDGVVRLWDIASEREVHAFSGHSGAVTSVAFSPDGRFALSAARDGSAILWDIASGRKVRTFAGAGSLSDAAALFAPDGRRMLSGACSGHGLALWDIGSGRPLREFNRDTYVDCPSAFSPDGRSLLVAGLYRGVKVFNVASGRLLRSAEWSSYGEGVRAFAFSSDGRSVAWGSEGGAVRLWDVAGANTLWGRISWAFTPAVRPRRFAAQHSGEVKSVAFTADGLRILSAGGDSLIMSDVATGEALVTLRLFTEESWLAVTGSGFYESSVPQDVRELRKLTTLKGLTRCSDAEIEQALHRPDLVAENLAGDGAGKVKAAIAALDLDKACSDGPH